MNVFNRLLKLYKHNGLKTPLEDFTTEILVSILDANPEILDSFVNGILKISGKGFRITSQEHFLSDQGIQNCRVDIIIRNEATLCFIENKVHSTEGNDQLFRYSKALDGYQSSISTYLRYCTKYRDKKQILDHDFLQFRWQDVSKFLRKWKHIGFINEYLQFLKFHHMNTNTSFSAIDLVALENINPLILKLDIYLQKVKPMFEAAFGKINNINNLQQIKEKSRFVFVKVGPFGNGYNELGVGFDFNDTPRLIVWIWSDNRNDKFDEYKKSLSTLDHNKFATNEEDWMALYKPISSFIESNNIEIDIEQWFSDSFDEIQKFAESNKNLNWNLPIIPKLTSNI